MNHFKPPRPYCATSEYCFTADSMRRMAEFHCDQLSRRERAMNAALRSFIGPLCPQAPEDMLMVLDFMGYEPHLMIYRNGHSVFIIRDKKGHSVMALDLPD